MPFHIYFLKYCVIFKKSAVRVILFESRAVDNVLKNDGFETMEKQ
jgi:hypothetical protein